MKKIYTLLIVLLSIAFLPHEAYSDSWYKARSSCKWWRKKYKTLAKIKKHGQSWKRDWDKGCTWAESFISASDYNCNGYYFIAAEAYAYAGDSYSNTNWSYVGYCQNWTAGYDVDDYNPRYSIVPLMEYSEFDNNEIYVEKKYGSKTTTQDIIWDYSNNRVILKGVSIELSVSPKNIANNYAVAMLRLERVPREGEDEKISELVFEESKYFVYNGELISEGNLTREAPVKINKVDIGDYRVTIDSVIFDLNKNNLKDITIDDIQVASYSDIGNLGMGIPDVYAIDFNNNEEVREINKKLLSEAEFNFTIYPNPVNTELNVNTTTDKDGKFNVNIINLSGVSCLDLGSSIITKGTSTMKFDISSIPAGPYFLQFTNGEQIYYKKFIKK